ncbi:hypothetical protein MC885_010996, partial [Smutsia gigantea]
IRTSGREEDSGRPGESGNGERGGCRPGGKEGKRSEGREGGGTQAQRKRKGKKKLTWVGRRDSRERRSKTEMELQGCLACLLLALCLGSGEAVPLLNGDGNAAASVGEAVGHGVGEVTGKGVRDAISQGAGELAHQEAEEAAGSGAREAMGTLLGEAAHLGVEEAFHNAVEGTVRALGNAGGEAGREAENLIRHGTGVSHGSWQGMPGTNSAWGTHGQPPSGGRGIFGSRGGPGGYSQGNPGGPGTPWGPGHSAGLDSRFGTPSQGSSGGHRGNGGPANLGTDAQKAVARRDYGSTRSSSSLNTECINSPPSGSDGSSGSSGESGGQSIPAPQESGGHGGSGGSSSEPGQDQPSGNSGNFDQSSYAEPQGYNMGYSSESSSSRGENKPGCDNTGNEVHVSGGSGGQVRARLAASALLSCSWAPSLELPLLGPSPALTSIPSRLWGSYNQQWSRGGDEVVSGINTLNTQMAPGPFNFDNFWKNFKSKLTFINWDAINKGQVPPPSTRALLYFSRLWEDFKHNTPFLNWKVITEVRVAEALILGSGSSALGTWDSPAPGNGSQIVAPCLTLPAEGGCLPSCFPPCNADSGVGEGSCASLNKEQSGRSSLG